MPERATFEELLEFANEVRRAGGGNPIDALMPAVPADATRCLIAKNLNFNCNVIGADSYSDDNLAWAMVVEDSDVRDRIAEALNLPVVRAHGDFEHYGEEGQYLRTTYVTEGIQLPERIGQVAHDFDEAQRIIERLDAGGQALPEEKRLVEEMWPYIEESIRECSEIGTIIDGKLVL